MNITITHNNKEYRLYFFNNFRGKRYIENIGLNLPFKEGDVLIDDTRFIFRKVF